MTEIERVVIAGEVVEPALQPIFTCPHCDATITDKQHVLEGYCSVCREVTGPARRQQVEDRIRTLREPITELTEVKHSPQAREGSLGWGNFWNYPPPFNNFDNRV